MKDRDHRLEKLSYEAQAPTIALAPSDVAKMEDVGVPGDEDFLEPLMTSLEVSQLLALPFLIPLAAHAHQFGGLDSRAGLEFEVLSHHRQNLCSR